MKLFPPSTNDCLSKERNHLILPLVSAFMGFIPSSITAQNPATLFPDRAENGALSLRLTSQTDSYYILRHTTSPNQEFQPVQMKLGTGNEIHFTPILGDSNAAFFQVQSVSNASPLDLDSDGLDDCYELQRSAFLHPLNPQEPLAPFFEAQIASDKIYAGDQISLFIDAQDHLWGWGLNTSGALGPDTSPESIYPQPHPIDQQSVWKQIGATENFSLALKKDGTLWAWGKLLRGDPPASFRILPDSDRWASIHVSSKRALAVRTDGTLWLLEPSTLLDEEAGNSENILQAVPLETDHTWASASAGDTHTLAIRADGSLWAWGENGVGQLGLGHTDGPLTAPTQVGTAYNWVYATAGLQTSLAIKSDGTLWAWGSNTYRQLGLNSSGNYSTPTQVGSDQDWTHVNIGLFQGPFQGPTVALKSNQTIWGWGYNSLRNLGFPNTTVLIANPVQLQPDPSWSVIKTGYRHTLALREDGSLMSWGDETNGALGDGLLSTFLSTPMQLDSYPGTTSMSPLLSSMFSVRDDGSLWNWQNGKATQIQGENWEEISSRFDGSLIRKTDGSLWGLGISGSGQLGIPGGNQFLVPTQLPGDQIWKKMMHCTLFSLAIDSEDNLWGWGDNSQFQLAASRPVTQSRTPIQIVAGTKWRHAAGDFYTAFGIQNDGSLWGWGHNRFGTVGVEGELNFRSPTPISPESSWLTVDCLASHTVAIQQDGSLWAWGYNESGQVGDGTFENVFSPRQIGEATSWTDAQAMSMSSIGLQSDGSLWIWGTVGHPLVADGSTSFSSGPVQVGSETDWVKIEAGYDYYLALKADGTLWIGGDIQNNLIPIDSPIQRWVAFPNL